MFEPRRSHLRDRLAEAVALELPHRYRPAFEGRAAGVLLLFGLPRSAVERDAEGTVSLDELRILVTRRTERLATHKLQYALPGGAQDLVDLSIEATALRETEEEMGIDPEEVETLGILPELWTPSGYRITPVVGFLKRAVEDVAICPNAEEVDHWFWCGLGEMRAPAVYSQEKREIRHAERSYSVDVDVFQIEEHRIWGATGAILKNFFDRLEKLG